MNVKPKMSISDVDFVNNVHPYLAWMRENAPVYEATFTRGKSVYLVTRYDDVMGLLKGDELMKNPQTARGKDGKKAMAWVPGMVEALMNNMLNTDEPDHRRLRNLVHKGFTPRRIQELEGQIEGIAASLLDKAVAKGEFDLIQDFALPLPLTVIMEMIGIPEADRDKFARYASSIVALPTTWNMIKMLPNLWLFFRYTRQLAAKRRAEPRDDLLTALALAEAEGDKLTENELLSTIFLLLVAGHETTVNLIANGMLALVDHPEQWARLRAEPELVPSAIEEFLRYDGPLVTTEMAFARHDFQLHGVDIPQGAMVLPAIMAANRDETVFAEPNQLDIGRTPNKHLAFGQGIHYCLGAPLARLEGVKAFEMLLARAPNLRLGVPRERLVYEQMPILHRLQSLPVVV
ncbi:MAG TPA: cytochrome P450 [Anaerolineae bacterium]|nr:cytochrome P450 [Anaerolineae bacterium]